MRRHDRAITLQETQGLLESGEYGVLSTVGEEGQPYGIPLNYVYRDNAIYFHCAPEGRKIGHMERNPRVSFCVVGRTKVLPEKFSTEYESAIVFGLASEVQGAEKDNALLWLVEKYSPGFVEQGKEYIERDGRSTRVFRIEITSSSGKARR